jgi:hypothetical protein
VQPDGVAELIELLRPDRQISVEAIDDVSQ